MPAIDYLIDAKRANAKIIQKARRKGDAREWSVVLGHDNATVYLTYGKTRKNAKLWLKHLTADARRTGKLAPSSSVNSNTIEVRLLGGSWVSLDANLGKLTTAVKAKTDAE